MHVAYSQRQHMLVQNQAPASSARHLNMKRFDDRESCATASLNNGACYGKRGAEGQGGAGDAC